MVVTALFTKSSGQPAAGLTLSDIAIYLYARAKSDGTVTTIWSGENPTEEIGGGLYSKAYDADTTTYDYYAYAVYSGSETLDTNYAVMQHPFAISSTAGAGAITFTYTLTDGGTVTVPFANVFYLRDGRITDYLIYVDASAVFGPSRP